LEKCLLAAANNGRTDSYLDEVEKTKPGVCSDYRLATPWLDGKHKHSFPLVNSRFEGRQAVLGGSISHPCESDRKPAS
jgi:hypothetical protein